MFQKFYTDTLSGRYIKSLLAQTPFPLFDSVIDGDHLVAGCYYVYRKFIIQCVSGGVLAVSKSENLFPSDTLYPSVYLFPGTGIRGARFYVKSHVEQVTPQTHSVFKSSTNYYDSETHFHLGRYLRYLYTTTGLNLFPFYNCYNSTYFSDVELLATSNNEVSINRVSNSNYKVIGIPILFGHDYSVFIDCPNEVLMRACIHDNTGYVQESTLLKDTALQNVLSTSGRIFPSLSFQDPVTYRVETDSRALMQFQRNLYLLIQVPQHNNSSVVVLENYDRRTGIHCNKDCVKEPSLVNPSLLAMNTRASYAFSDRLVEYLLGNVIHPDDVISKNIANIQTTLSQIYPSYKRAFLRGDYLKGVWDTDLSRLTQLLVEKYAEENLIYDQDGNINRDTELLIYLKGGNYQ